MVLKRVKMIQLWPWGRLKQANKRKFHKFFSGGKNLNQNITFYTSKLHNLICQLYFKKLEIKRI